MLIQISNNKAIAQYRIDVHKGDRDHSVSYGGTLNFKAIRKYLDHIGMVPESDTHTPFSVISISENQTKLKYLP